MSFATALLPQRKHAVARAHADDAAAHELDVLLHAAAVRDHDRRVAGAVRALRSECAESRRARFLAGELVERDDARARAAGRDDDAVAIDERRLRPVPLRHHAAAEVASRCSCASVPCPVAVSSAHDDRRPCRPHRASAAVDVGVPRGPSIVVRARRRRRRCASPRSACRSLRRARCTYWPSRAIAHRVDAAAGDRRRSRSRGRGRSWPNSFGGPPSGQCVSRPVSVETPSRAGRATAASCRPAARPGLPRPGQARGRQRNPASHGPVATRVRACSVRRVRSFALGGRHYYRCRSSKCSDVSTSRLVRIVPVACRAARVRPDRAVPRAQDRAAADGKEIVARHVTAMGGEAAFKAIKSIRARGTFSMSAQGDFRATSR